MIGVGSRKRRGAIAFALAAVAMMMLSPIVLTNDESDATISVRSMSDYGYIMHYDSTNTQVTKVEKVDVNGNRTTIYNGTNTSRIASEFAFDPDTSETATGLGPFNLFYAAVNLNTNPDPAKPAHAKETHIIGHIGYVLNPFDLSKNKYGEDITPSEYNIMLVIPTVYWYSDAASNKMYISNLKNYPGFDSSIWPNMKAYAHTIKMDGTNDTVVPYVAIGVYESIISGDRILSQPSDSYAAVTSNTNATIVPYGYDPRNYANNLNGSVEIGGKYMLWNFHQWTLFKIMTYTVLGNKNIRAVPMIDEGDAYTNISITTIVSGSKPGATAAIGPYSHTQMGTISNRVLLENAYGSGWDLVDQIYITNVASDRTLKITNKASPAAGEGLDTGTAITATTAHLPKADDSHRYIISAYKESDVWDLPNALGASGPNTVWSSDNPAKNNQFYVGGAGNDRVSFGSVGTGTAAGSIRLAYAFPGSAVTYDANGGDGTAPTDDGHYTIGSTIEIASDGGLSKEGYKFVGWRCTYSYANPRTGTIVPVSELVPSNTVYGLSTTPVTNITMTAQWAELYYKVEFEGTGSTSGTMDVQYVPVDEPVPIRKNMFTKTGEAFSGWSSEATTSIYQDRQTVQFVADTVLHALWSTYHNVYYDLNGLHGKAPESTKAYEGQSFRVAGYDDARFKGWKASTDDETYEMGSIFVMPATDVVFSAVWEKEPKPEYPEDDDDILDLLNRQTRPAQSEDGRLTMIVVAVATTLVAAAAVMVITIFRR